MLRTFSLERAQSVFAEMSEPCINEGRGKLGAPEENAGSRPDLVYRKPSLIPFHCLSNILDVLFMRCEGGNNPKAQRVAEA